MSERENKTQARPVASIKNDKSKYASCVYTVFAALEKSQQPAKQLQSPAVRLPIFKVQYWPTACYYTSIWLWPGIGPREKKEQKK